MVGGSMHCISNLTFQRNGLRHSNCASLASLPMWRKSISISHKTPFWLGGSQAGISRNLRLQGLGHGTCAQTPLLSPVMMMMMMMTMELVVQELVVQELVAQELVVQELVDQEQEAQEQEALDEEQVAKLSFINMRLLCELRPLHPIRL